MTQLFRLANQTQVSQGNQESSGKRAEVPRFPRDALERVFLAVDLRSMILVFRRRMLGELRPNVSRISCAGYLRTARSSHSTRQLHPLVSSMPIEAGMLVLRRHWSTRHEHERQRRGGSRPSEERTPPVELKEAGPGDRTNTIKNEIGFAELIKQPTAQAPKSRWRPGCAQHASDAERRSQRYLRRHRQVDQSKFSSEACAGHLTHAS